MSAENETGFMGKLGRGLGGFLKFLIRLIFVLALAIALGAGIFYGVSSGIPAVNRVYVQPVRENSARLANLEARATQDAVGYAEQLSGMDARVTTLEVQNDTNESILDNFETELAGLGVLMDGQTALSERLDALDAALVALEADMTADSTAQDSALAGVQAQVNDNQDRLDTVDEFLASQDVPLDQAYADLQLIKVMTLLTRSQVHIFQNNIGLAQQDVETARTLLLALANQPAFAEDDLGSVLLRLDLALANLPDRGHLRNGSAGRLGTACGYDRRRVPD